MLNLFRKKEATAVTERKLPVHVGIIMDGNGRWAKNRGLPRKMGHRAGAENFKTIVRYSNSIGIRYLTVYAFSTENWTRPQDEVNALIQLFVEYLEEALRDFLNENIRVRFMGDVTAFPENLQELIGRITTISADRTGMTLNICLNYGGRAEIARAARNLAQKVQEGALDVEAIDEDAVKKELYFGDQPDVDLVIRPSGECRTSNFLLWQTAYAEYVFMNTLWPDFSPEKLEEALDQFAGRNRRFGGVKP